MQFSITEFISFFIIYAFLGWCVEVAYHVVTNGNFINRGFLNGPICPIYGLGMIILIYCLYPLVDNFILLFFGSFFLTSTLEYITGFVLEKVFHDKWWDYTDLPFNLRGYVCLSFSIAWGLGAVFMLNIVHPTLYRFISIFDNKIGIVILLLLLAFFIIDLIITVLGIMKIKKHLLLLSSIADDLKSISNIIGERIYKSMNVAIKTRYTMNHKLKKSRPVLKSSINEKRNHVIDLKVKYRKVLRKKGFVHRRLEKAFPNLKSRLSTLHYKKK